MTSGMRASSRKVGAHILWYVAATSVGAVFLFPLLIAAFASLKPSSVIVSTLFSPPHSLYLGNYRAVFKLENFARAWGVSLLVAVSGGVIQTALAVTFGYALARRWDLQDLAGRYSPKFPLRATARLDDQEERQGY